MDGQHGQVGDVVCVLDGTSTFANDTRSSVTIQLTVNLALYVLRPVDALSVHLVKLANPVAHLYPKFQTRAKCMSTSCSSRQRQHKSVTC